MESMHSSLNPEREAGWSLNRCRRGPPYREIVLLLGARSHNFLHLAFISPASIPVSRCTLSALRALDLCRPPQLLIDKTNRESLFSQRPDQPKVTNYSLSLRSSLVFSANQKIFWLFSVPISSSSVPSRCWSLCSN
ncbi:MAG: hypothetical protein Q8P67_18615 [archaeon]|nr:hypothetical protein [archaeon]